MLFLIKVTTVGVTKKRENIIIKKEQMFFTSQGFLATAKIQLVKSNNC